MEKKRRKVIIGLENIVVEKVVEDLDLSKELDKAESADDRKHQNRAQQDGAEVLPGPAPSDHTIYIGPGGPAELTTGRLTSS